MSKVINQEETCKRIVSFYEKTYLIPADYSGVGGSLPFLGEQQPYCRKIFGFAQKPARKL